MKKLLAIVVLSLLWGGNVYSDIEPANPNIVHEVIVKPSLDVKVSGESKTSGQWKYKVIHKTYSQAKNMALETCKDKIIKHNGKCYTYNMETTQCNKNNGKKIIKFE